MKRIALIAILLVACVPILEEKPEIKQVIYPTATSISNSTSVPLVTITTAETTKTSSPVPVQPSETPTGPTLTNTAVPTNTPENGISPLPTTSPLPNITSVPTASPNASYTLAPTADFSPTSGINIYVKVTADKTVLRQISSYNDAGYPIMSIREPRLRFNRGDILPVYANGGEDGGPLYRSNGADYYYRIYDSDGQEEELYVPAWHVMQSEAPTATPEGTLTSSPTEEQSTIFVQVTAYKTVLRVIGSYNKKGVPIMEVREPRIRYENGEIIEVYANGGENDGPTYRTDGADYYYRVFDPDGQEEELYVPSWHVEIVIIN